MAEPVDEVAQTLLGLGFWVVVEEGFGFCDVGVGDEGFGGGSGGVDDGGFFVLGAVRGVGRSL